MGAGASVVVAAVSLAAALMLEVPPPKVRTWTSVYAIEWVKGDRAAMLTSVAAARAARKDALACFAKGKVPAGLVHVQVRKGSFAVIEDIDPDVASCLAAALGKAAEPGVDLRIALGGADVTGGAPKIVPGKSEAPGLKPGAVAGAWKKWAPDLAACVLALRARNPEAAGVGELILRVGDDGTVTDATAVGAPALSGEAGGRDCVSVVPLGWKLPVAKAKPGVARIVVIPVTIGDAKELAAAKAAAAARKLDHAGVAKELMGAPLHLVDDGGAKSVGPLFALEDGDVEKIQIKLADFFDCHGADGAGAVELLVHLGPGGDFDDARVVRLAGPARLEECALELVYKTRLGVGGRTGWAAVKLEKK